MPDLKAGNRQQALCRIPLREQAVIQTPPPRATFVPDANPAFSFFIVFPAAARSAQHVARRRIAAEYVAGLEQGSGRLRVCNEGSAG